MKPSPCCRHCRSKTVFSCDAVGDDRVLCVAGFLQPVFWAALLASLFHPVHRRLLAKMPEKVSLSALLVLLLILVIVILPLLFVGFAVARESVGLYQRVANGEINVHKPLAWSAQALPMVNRLLDRVGIAPDQLTEWLSSSAATISKFLGQRAIAFG
jgi:predicted PurR-regulated permease PerM